MAIRLWCVLLFFFAGSQLFFELIIEWIIIMWILSDPYFAMNLERTDSGFTSSPLMKLFVRFSSGKIDKLRSVLHGPKPSRTILLLVFTAVAIGLLMILPQIFWRNLPTLVARELAEIVLDILIFIPAFIMIRAFYNTQKSLIKNRHAIIRKGYDDEDDTLNAESTGYEDLEANLRSVFGINWPTEKGRIENSYFLSSLDSGYPFGPAPIDFVREEERLEQESYFADELRTARIFRGITFLIGLLPFAVGMIAARFIDWRIVNIMLPYVECAAGLIIER